MTKFRHRPLIVDAVQYHKGETLPHEDLFEAADGEIYLNDSIDDIYVPDGAWIIEHGNSDYTVLMADIFEAMYEQIESDSV